MPFKVTCLECGGEGRKITVFKDTPEIREDMVEPCPTCQGSGLIYLTVECWDKTNSVCHRERCGGASSCTDGIRKLDRIDVETLEGKYAMTAVEIVTELHTSKIKFSLVGQDVQLVPAKKG